MGLRSLPTLLLQTLDALTSVRPRVLKVDTTNMTLVNNGDGTATIGATGGGGGGGSLQYTVENQTGGTLTKGTVVFDTNASAVGVQAQGLDYDLPNPPLGIVSADIADTATGTVIGQGGAATGLDTHLWAVGTQLYAGLNGALTDDAGSHYNHAIGWVTVSHATAGVVAVVITEFGPPDHGHTTEDDGGPLGFPTFSEIASGSVTTPGALTQAVYIDSTTHHLTRKTSGAAVVDIETLGGTPAVATDAIWDAKGDLAAGTGADTAAKVTVGANDTILMADSAQSTGLKWVASQTPSTQAFSDTAAQGTADTYARGDHVHGMPASPGGGGLYSAYLCYQDQKSSSTVGGTFTSGAWRTRDLNTEVADTGSNGSVASNQISLAAGTYDVLVTAPTYSVSRNALRLQNITDTATLLSGTSNYSSVASDGNSIAVLQGTFTIAGTKTIEVQHQSSSTGTSTGFGLAMGTSFTVGTEIYTSIQLWKR